jgi:hypothetical protein
MAFEERRAEEASGAAHSLLDPWYCALREATSGIEVVTLANDFIGQCGSDELATLPRGCGPWRMSALSDVDLYAYLLSTCGREEGGSGAWLGLMRSFFHAASTRLAQFTQSTTSR